MKVAATRKLRPAPYRQIDLLRDGVFCFYIVFNLCFGLQRLLLGGGAALGGGNVINQAVSALMFAVGLLCVLYNKAPLARLVRGAMPFLLPTFLVIISLSWSDYPDIGLRRALRFLLELGGLIMLVACYRNSRSFLRTLAIAFSILVGLDLAALIAPTMSITSIGYAGVHGHKNTLGSFCYTAIPVFFLVWRTKLFGGWSFLGLGLLALTLLLLAASLSKTALVLVGFCSVSAYIAYYIWQRGPAMRLAAASIFVLFVLVVTLPIASSGMNFGEVLGAVTGDPTMTGRTDVWDYTMWRVGERTLTGVGYGSFWDVDESSVELMNQFGITFAFSQSHNGYIGVFAELGWPGVAAVVIMWIIVMSMILRRAWNRAEWPLIGYGLYVALGSVLYNVTETWFLRAAVDGWVNFVVVSAAVAVLLPAAQPQRATVRAPMRRPAPNAAPLGPPAGDAA